MGGYSEKCPHCERWFTTGRPALNSHIRATHPGNRSLTPYDLPDFGGGSPGLRSDTPRKLRRILEGLTHNTDVARST
jgi:hypothetical protein